MFSLFFARPVALRAIASVSTRPQLISVVFRRSLFATPSLGLPTAKTSQSTVKTRKTTAKKAPKVKRAVPAKRGRPPKPVSARQEKQTEQENKRVHIPKHLQPPKRAPGPYLIFYANFIKSQPKASSLDEFRALSKRAGEIWRGYSMVEKQPFYDECEARKARANQDREEFFRNTSLSDLRKLNTLRKAQGKKKVHSGQKTSLPLTPFILFLNEFRNNPDSKALIDNTSPEKRYTIRVVVAGGDRWRSMSQEEKAPYFERFAQAKQELKAEQSAA